MELSDWNFLAVVSDGEVLEIDDVDVWWEKWRSLRIGVLQVPHPNYSNQTHTLRLYAIEPAGRPILFCAGELSSNVWCFYVPAKGQPCQTLKGMTVNERLYEANLDDTFTQAITAANCDVAKDTLIASGFSGTQAEETVAAIYKDPKKYGF